MADNVATAAGSVATDEIGGQHFQRIKNTWGPDGTATDTDATSAAAMPMRDIGAGTSAASQVTVTNTSTTILSARTTAPARRSALLLNLQTVPVYLDPNGGTASLTTGFRLDPGASVILPVTSQITGITTASYSASGDAKVHVIELY